MIISDIDQDPFLITNWHQYAKDCIEAGELWRFRKALCDYIWLTNRPVLEDQRAYCVRRQGEWARDDLQKQITANRERPYRGPKRPPMV